MSFRGKRVLITGSSRGIGRGIALKLAEKGARLAVHSILVLAFATVNASPVKSACDAGRAPKEFRKSECRSFAYHAGRVH